MTKPRMVRRVARALVPDFIRERRAERIRRRLRSATQKLWTISQGRVLGGPFAGMELPRAEYSHLVGPMLLGTYEQELHALVQTALLNGAFDRVVNVGAAEGYYACGLLRARPGLRVTAFEASPETRQLLAGLAARLNVSERLEIRGLCAPPDLRAALAGSGAETCVLMDVEGAERQLLDPAAVPELRSCPILVELHETFAPGVTEEIRARFAPSHTLSYIPAVDRTADRLPRVQGMSTSEVSLTAYERDENQGWLWMKPR